MLGIVLYYLAVYFFRLLEILIFIRVVLSWLPVKRQHTFIQLIYKLTEPLLAPSRNLLEKSAIGASRLMVDFSPVITLIVLDFIRMCILYFIGKYLIF